MRPPVSPFFIAAVGLMCASPALADDPTQAEQDLFKAIRARLEGHKAQWPQAVQQTLDSIDHEITLTKNCPNGTKVSSVVLKIRTKLAHWAGSAAGEDGEYVWNCSPGVANGKKTLTCDNQILLDEGKLGPEEKEKFGQIANEGLLYHELLHGQQVIDALEDAAWLKRVCNCEFPLYPAGDESVEDDAGKGRDAHARINEQQNTYTIDAAKKEGFTVKTQDIRGKAEDGKFELTIELKDLIAEGKENYTYILTSPENVEDIGAEQQGTKLILRGKLKDKTKSGKLTILVDPPLSAGVARVTITGKAQTNPAVWLIVLGAAIAVLLLAFVGRRLWGR